MRSTRRKAPAFAVLPTIKDQMTTTRFTRRLALTATWLVAIAMPSTAGTSCPNLGGNSGCGDYYNCKHSASVVCNGALTATVTYTTTCRDPHGGTYETTTSQNVLQTSSESITNACNCRLTPSLSQTWGAICNEGVCCACFDLICN